MEFIVDRTFLGAGIETQIEDAWTNIQSQFETSNYGMGEFTLFLCQHDLGEISLVTMLAVAQHEPEGLECLVTGQQLSQEVISVLLSDTENIAVNIDLLQVNTKIEIGLPAMAAFMSQFEDPGPRELERIQTTFEILISKKLISSQNVGLLLVHRYPVKLFDERITNLAPGVHALRIISRVIRTYLGQIIMEIKQEETSQAGILASLQAIFNDIEIPPVDDSYSEPKTDPAISLMMTIKGNPDLFSGRDMGAKIKAKMAAFQLDHLFIKKLPTIYNVLNSVKPRLQIGELSEASLKLYEEINIYNLNSEQLKELLKGTDNNFELFLAMLVHKLPKASAEENILTMDLTGLLKNIYDLLNDLQGTDFGKEIARFCFIFGFDPNADIPTVLRQNASTIDVKDIVLRMLQGLIKA